MCHFLLNKNANEFKNNFSFNLIRASNRHSQSHWISSEIPHSQLSYLKVIEFDQYRLHGGWLISKNLKPFNCSLDFNLTHLFTVSLKLFSDVFGGEDFSMTVWRHWCWKWLQNGCRKKIKFKPPWTFLKAELFTLLLCCAFSFHRSEFYLKT